MDHVFFRTTEKASILKRCGGLLLALLFSVLFLLSAFAEETTIYIPQGGVDLQRKGSVRVFVNDVDGNLVSGGSLQLYHVAQITETDGKQTHTLTEEFSGWDGSADSLISDRTCAESLSAYIEKNHTEFMTSVKNEKGSAVFTNIIPGIYLIQQNEPAPGYETLSPFLVFVPQLVDGKIIYDVEAIAKPIEPLPPGQLAIVVEKKLTVVRGTAPKDTVFSFVLTPESPEAPLPNNPDAVLNSQTGAMTVSRTGPGTVKFGTLRFTLADVGAQYEYSIREVIGSVAHYTYDNTVYKLIVRVDATEDGKLVLVSALLTDGEGKAVNLAQFENKYDGGNTPDIPRTGQLWWPVLIMLPAGLLLILIGFAFRRRADMPEDPV